MFLQTGFKLTVRTDCAPPKVFTLWLVFPRLIPAWFLSCSWPLPCGVVYLCSVVPVLLLLVGCFRSRGHVLSCAVPQASWTSTTTRPCPSAPGARTRTSRQTTFL